MSTNFILLSALFLWIQSLQAAVKITECPNEGVTLREDRYPAVFTCEGLTATENVTWTLPRKGSSSSTLSVTCSPRQALCSVPSDEDIFVVRTENKSLLMITKEYRWRAGEDSLRCGGESGDLATCDLDVLHPANLSNCEVTASNEDWTVSGTCDFAGAYSSRPEAYYCTWYQYDTEQSAENQTFPGEIEKVVIVISDADYYNGTCSFSAPLQSEGSYSYDVSFFPGPARSMVKSINIERPGDPVSSCHGYNISASDIVCDCLPSPTTPGYPLPTTQWNGLNPGQQLTITDLSTVDTNHVCRLTWGPLDARETRETPLAFGPDDVHIIQPQGPQIPDKDFALTCAFSNVYPSVLVAWVTPSTVQCRLSPDNRTCNFVVKRWHDGESITCSAQNSLLPDVLNGSSSFMLSVSLDTTATDPTESPPGITSPRASASKAAPDRALVSKLIIAIACVVVAFILILFIIGVIVAFRSRRRRSESRENITAKENGGLDAHPNPLYQDAEDESPQPRAVKPSGVALRVSSISEESLNSSKDEADAGYSTVTFGADQTLAAGHTANSHTPAPIIHTGDDGGQRKKDEEEEEKEEEVVGDKGKSASPGVSSFYYDDDNASSTQAEVDRDSKRSRESVTSFPENPPADDNAANEDDPSMHVYSTVNRGSTRHEASESATRDDPDINGDDDPYNHLYATVDKSSKKSTDTSAGDHGGASNQDSTHAHDEGSMTNYYREADGSSRKSDVSELTSSI